MRKPAFLVLVTYLVRADSPEAALEATKAIVHDPAFPINGISIGESSVYEEPSEPLDF